jgi:nicotinamidase-related amidase
MILVCTVPLSVHFEAEDTMKNNPNELTIENSALVLIDHQPAVGLAVHSMDQGLLLNNVAALARAAKALGVPAVLSTIGAKGSVLVDPIFKEISNAFPEITPIDRTSTHAWSDPKFRAAINATGRKKLIMAGIVTGTCLSQSALAALKDGFEVYIVCDCSGDVSSEAHDAAKLRMTQAGAKPITWLNVTGEWAPDYKSPERAALTGIYAQRGGTVSLAVEYAIDQVEGGVVPAPDFLSAPVKAG